MQKSEMIEEARKAAGIGAPAWTQNPATVVIQLANGVEIKWTDVSLFGVLSVIEVME